MKAFTKSTALCGTGTAPLSGARQILPTLSARGEVYAINLFEEKKKKITCIYI